MAQSIKSSLNAVAVPGRLSRFDFSLPEADHLVFLLRTGADFFNSLTRFPFVTK